MYVWMCGCVNYCRDVDNFLTFTLEILWISRVYWEGNRAFPTFTLAQ